MQKFDANATNLTEVRMEKRMDKRMNIRTDGWVGSGMGLVGFVM